METTPPASPSAGLRQPGLAVTLGLYTLARLGLVAVVAALLLLAGVPLIIAVLVALIVALPLSMVLFRGLRGRLDEALAAARERRARERAALRARLRGDDGDGSDKDYADAASDEPAQDQPDRGED
jgi:membrane protein implicated in regulation of membrane protease activity